MTNFRLLYTLQVLCICLVVFGKTNSVDAFQPSHTNRALISGWNSKNIERRLPFYLSSSVSKDASESTAATVKVVNAAALISGPAHAAALENHTRIGIANGGPNPTPNPTSESLSTSLSSPNDQAEEPSQPVTPQPISPKAPPRARQTAARKTPKGPVTTVESVEQLLAVMDCTDTANNGEEINGNDERDLTLVLFHAHYCKICQRATMQLTKAAREYPSVNFAKVESKVIPEPAADNLRTLGVSKFPFVQVYRRGDCVASFSTGPTHMFLRKVRGTLDLCLERDEDCWDDFSNDFQTEIQSNRDARNQLRPDLLP